MSHSKLLVAFGIAWGTSPLHAEEPVRTSQMLNELDAELTPIDEDMDPLPIANDWESLYSGAFGLPEGALEEGDAPEEAFEESTSKALLAHSSFPVFIEAQGAKEPPKQVGQEALEPPVVSKSFVLGDCRFKITTGPWTASRLAVEARALVTLEDAMAPGSRIVATQTDPALLRFGAEALLEVEEQAKDACRRELSAAPIALGSFGLEGSEVRIASSRTIKPKGKTPYRPLHAYWPEAAPNPTLLADDGPHPILETAVFVLKQGTMMPAPLVLSPALTHVPAKKAPLRQASRDP